MKLLIIYRHFWPDTPPYASMLRSIAGHLAREGHDVTVWTEMPSYKLSASEDAPRRARLDGAEVIRMRRLPLWRRSALVRTLAKAAFPLRVLLRAAAHRLAGRRYDLVMTATIPPVINGAAGALSARLLGAGFVYHFQDVYPELGAVSGLWAEDSPTWRVLMAIERRTCRRMSRAVVLSDDMAATLRARGVAPDRIMVINNFMLDSFEHGASADDVRREGSFQVIFAGNLGRFQGLPALVEAAGLLRDLGEFELVFLGEGAALESLRSRAAGLPNVRFLPHMPFERARSVIAAADVGVVSLQPEIYRMAYPSKALTYLGLGLPILAVIEPESALARLVTGERLGAVAARRDAAAIADAIRTLHARRADLPEMRARAEAVYRRCFSRDAALERWRALFDAEGRHHGA